MNHFLFTMTFSLNLIGILQVKTNSSEFFFAMSSVNKKLTTMLQLSANVNTLNLTYIFTKEDALRMDTFEAANKDVNALKVKY